VDGRVVQHHRLGLDAHIGIVNHRVKGVEAWRVLDGGVFQNKIGAQ
jgi:hypothetical protein